MLQSAVIPFCTILYSWMYITSASVTACTTHRGSIRDMFHVYLDRFEFHFLRLHINKTNEFCFVMHNGHVPGIAK